ncbi:hypothetical protein SX4_2922 [Vibrio mimicus SX-4]|nr:hypothetical protein SX4_2922 [Vibrio mimicus SX-4]
MKSFKIIYSDLPFDLLMVFNFKLLILNDFILNYEITYLSFLFD